VRSKKSLGIFIGGMAVGVTLAIIVPLLLYIYVIPSWLVVKDEPVSSDAAVVLGGNVPARLRKAIRLYEAGHVKRLILVDVAEINWLRVIERLGPGYDIKGKPYTIVTGSSTTETDARLSMEECKRSGVKSIIAVTDPYHSRRASLTFGRVYAGSGIRVTTVNSGDYGALLTPQQNWRSHRFTRDLIWLETGKTVGALFPAFFRKLFIRDVASCPSEPVG